MAQRHSEVESLDVRNAVDVPAYVLNEDFGIWFPNEFDDLGVLELAVVVPIQTEVRSSRLKAQSLQQLDLAVLQIH